MVLGFRMGCFSCFARCFELLHGVHQGSFIFIALKLDFPVHLYSLSFSFWGARTHSEFRFVSSYRDENKGGYRISTRCVRTLFAELLQRSVGIIDDSLFLVPGFCGLL